MLPPDSGDFPAVPLSKLVLDLATPEGCKATVPQPSDLWFGVVRAVGRCIAVLHEGPLHPRGRGRYGVIVPHFYRASASYASTVLADIVCLCVCPSVCHKSELFKNG